MAICTCTVSCQEREQTPDVQVFNICNRSHNWHVWVQHQVVLSCKCLWFSLWRTQILCLVCTIVVVKILPSTRCQAQLAHLNGLVSSCFPQLVLKLQPLTKEIRLWSPKQCFLAVDEVSRFSLFTLGMVPFLLDAHCTSHVAVSIITDRVYNRA